MKQRYILSIFTREGRGHGLLSVHAEHPEAARQCGELVIGDRPYDVVDVQLFEKFADDKLIQLAVDEFIWKHTHV